MAEITRKSILSEAERCVCADREQAYGSPENNFSLIARLWREYLDTDKPITAHDVAADGSPAIGGSAMTKEYTTILHETLTGSYVVCFGDRPCYKVTNPSKDFINDMHQHRMVSLSEAKGRY